MPTLFNPNRRKGIFMIPSGATKSPTPTPPSFTNTYSLAFDGVDDYVSMGNPTELQITGELTLSCWVKISGSTGSNQALIYKDAAGAARSYKLQLQSSTNLANFTIFNGGTAFHTYSTSTINDGNWHHIVAVYTPSTSVVIYVDGVAETTNTSSVPASIDNDPAPFELGRRADGVFYLQGSLDEVAVFNTALTSENVTSIYNSGVPNDLTSLNPTAWYRNGDNGSYKSPQWLIPENSNKDKVSNYSFQFDGVDDSIVLSNTIDLGINSSISVWVNLDSNYSGVLLGSESYDNDYFIQARYNNFFVRIASVFNSFPLTDNALTAGSWHNLVVTRSGDSISTYVDGNFIETKTGYGTSITTKFDTIADRQTSSLPLEGKIDELSAFNTTLTSENVTSIYNSGTPTTLPVTPIAHYKMGEQANFTDNWLVNNSALSNYSTRSFNFDGVDDFINCGNITALNNAPNASWSFWMNPSATGFRYMFSAYGTSGPNQQIYFGKKGTGVQIRLRGQGYVGGTPIVFNESSQTWTLGTWYHIVVTFDGAESDNAQKVKVYVNGNPLTNTSVGAAITNINTTTENFYIALLGGYTTNEFGGNISNMAIWNNTLSSTEVQNLYANGMPQDLTTFTPQPINWWTLGKESFWDGADWVIRDMIGTNDGLSDNMGGSELKGDAPRSQANGVGTNIAVPTDLKGRAGWSDKNGYSINMSSTARTTDTP